MSSEAKWMLWRRSWTVTATHVARASLGVREVCGGYSVRVVVVLSEVLNEVVVLNEVLLSEALEWKEASTTSETAPPSRRRGSVCNNSLHTRVYTALSSGNNSLWRVTTSWIAFSLYSTSSARCTVRTRSTNHSSRCGRLHSRTSVTSPSNTDSEVGGSRSSESAHETPQAELQNRVGSHSLQVDALNFTSAVNAAPASARA